jgi:hypothetical protein
MTMRTTTTILAALSLGLTALGITGQAQAYQCKTQNEQASSVGLGQASTLSQARKKWTDAVRSEHGLAWSVYTIASAKQEGCAFAGGGTYACTAKAKPCLYVVP